MGREASHKAAAASAFTQWRAERCAKEKAGRRLVVDLAVTLLILCHKVVKIDVVGGAEGEYCHFLLYFIPPHADCRHRESDPLISEAAVGLHARAFLH